ncbi:sphingomyelin phosphodiesterase-like protein [Hortaea werneckii]|nr:sphingomyelin phosphodiesterase-like protein [Hortaea werneckii]KAI7109311.1 sphingomyelin phosphodiesterase-like protein [Hortaea werneckii]KAI7233838.1 sphingomyelin phosphodiesterase-like protein [Hortaea werneckii]KAI7330429.1 sphingomyelin phosphodiesterase-like protein [Hortaea werneckii]KAI7383538.1 sphingomyelin phosphodiesterase-like protein [Hortaea werneckii]
MAIFCGIMAAAALLSQRVLADAASGELMNAAPGQSRFTAPAGYPTTAFSSYYPVPSEQQPQPALYDPVLNITFPRNLTNPDTIPDHDPDPVYFPRPVANLTVSEQEAVIESALSDNSKIINGSYIEGNCSKCVASLQVAQNAARLAPNTTKLFPKPKPANATKPNPSGERVRVLHMSDFHIDPRYKVGSEGNCTSGLCCRGNVENEHLSTGEISYPAPLYGYYQCDTPYDLGLAALQAVGPLTGTSKDNPLAWTIYTGDLVSHDPQTQLSRAYTEYAEDSIYTLFKKYLTGPQPGNLSTQMSWNYNHVAGLWKHEGWINETAEQQARVHYGAYSVKNHYGLRMITFNTDFWYHSNYLNYINTSNPDVSGTFEFMIQELQVAEDAGERVWIFGHVLSCWNGEDPLNNPSDLFYQIVDRYSPHVIANIFFGHSHEDQIMIYYSNNGTKQTRETALNAGWIGPSITPLTNVNSGFRLYEVDTATFDILDAYTFYSDVQSFPALANSTHGPVFQYEYSTRDAYGRAAGWPEDAPLNATFWHAVTEAMEEDESNELVSMFNTFQGKFSVRSPNCTNDACAEAKVCYMRSGSAALGQACSQGYGSVQSGFSPS